MNVGIGTTSPYATLSVVGQVVGSYFTATSTTATSTFSGGISAQNFVGQDGSFSLPTFTWASNPTTGLSYDTGNSGISFNVGGVQKELLNSNGQYYNGNFQVGPTNQIGWGGTGYLNSTDIGFARLSPGVLTLDSSTKNNALGQLNLGKLNADSFAISTTTGTSTISGGFTVNTNQLLVNRFNGNVGIGLTNPAYKLEINGTASTTQLFLPNTTSASVGGIYFGNALTISNAGNQNFFAGVGAGNTSLSGQQNTAVGNGALSAITSGNYNSAIGLNSLKSHYGSGKCVVRAILTGLDTNRVRQHSFRQHDSL